MNTQIESYYPSKASFWLHAAAVGWFPLAMLTLALFAGALPIRYNDLASGLDPRIIKQLDLSPQVYAGFVVGLSVLLAAAHSTIAAMLFLRRKHDWMALLLAYALVTNGAVFPLSLAYPFQTTTVFLRMLVDLVIFISLFSSVSLLFLFPDGRFVPQWTRWLAVFWAAIHLPGIFFPNLPLSLPRWPVPIQIAVLFLFTGAGIAAQIYRYVNISNPTQRQQSKWGTLGLAASAIGPFAYYLPFIILPQIGGVEVSNVMFNRIGTQFYTFTFVLQMIGIGLFSTVMLVFPVSFAVAILRYRLWEIDILINRALVYSSLTALILVVYFTSVIALQQLIHLVTGLDRSEVATAASTILIAALFNPLQKRVQASVDRRFYRKKYDTNRTLAAFSEELRNEVDLATLVDDLLTVVQDTMQPDHISLWLKPEPETGSANVNSRIDA